MLSNNTKVLWLGNIVIIYSTDKRCAPIILVYQIIFYVIGFFLLYTYIELNGGLTIMFIIIMYFLTQLTRPTTYNQRGELFLYTYIGILFENEFDC